MEIIRLHKHDNEWINKFIREKNLLVGTLGDVFCEIYHIGSTAVPDLLSKSIIDISTESIEFPPSKITIEKLFSIGYECKGEAGIKNRIWFTKGHPRAFNLHYCSKNSEIVMQQITFRDNLIQNEKLRRQYELIKLRNSEGRDIDNAEYASSKSNFIEKVVTE